MRTGSIALMCLLAVECIAAQPTPECQWPERASAAVPLRDQVQLAEDVAVRFADALGETPHYRANRERCEAVLFASLAHASGVDLAKVQDARRSLADRPFDWAVNMPMATLVACAGFLLSRWSARRFGADEVLASWFAVAAGAVGIAVATVAIGYVWAAGVETLRIGNGHLSYRAERIPWQHHRALTLVLATVSVLSIHVAASFRSRRAA